MELAKIHKAIEMLHQAKQEIETSLKYLLTDRELYVRLKSSQFNSQLEKILTFIAQVYYGKHYFRMALHYYFKKITFLAALRSCRVTLETSKSQKTSS